ncbi:hypothetical protein BGX23_010976 [Mortierella sp. AD031]|nr:hypothetical protein BGX23_010976 [Mortierella sp. AD031]KAG0208265.1 hypothetical protein BGX33_006365 [Mortierella sp. NVP41]
MTTFDESGRKKYKKVVRIDIYSDTTCPWCYITKKRLEKAIKAFQSASSSLTSSLVDDVLKETANSVVHGGCTSHHHPPSVDPSSTAQPATAPTPTLSTSTPQPQDQEEEIHFDIHWRPYQLDPNAPRVPIRKNQLYHRKFGPEQAVKVQDRIVNAGRVEGIQFLYTDQSLYSNTIDSHRMIRFARERLGRLPPSVDTIKEINKRKSSDSGNGGTPYEQDSYFPNSYNYNHKDEEEEVDEWGARMEDAMVDELFRSHFERGECSEFETLKACARSVLVQTAAFSAAAAASLLLSSSSSKQSSSSSASASSLTSAADINNSGNNNNTNTNTNESPFLQSNATTNATTNANTKATTDKQEYARLLKAKEEELIANQLQELDLYLHSDEGLAEVKEEIRVAKEDLGMQGVPMIVIQNEYLLSGAQTPATFLQVLQRVL